MAEREQNGTAEGTKQSGRSEARREKKARRVDASPPATALEALERARRHARQAVAEALSAVHALLDAASLATTGVPAEAQRGLALVARALDDVAGAFGEGEGASLLGAVADALDAEIGRWEQRAAQDPEARAVLRAYLGVRELLWELGVRRPPSAEKPERARAGTRADALRRRTAIQRVPLEG